VKTVRRQAQREPTSDLKIIEIGGNKVLANLSNSTESSIAVDFASIESQLWQIATIAEQKHSAGLRYGPVEIRRDFEGKRVLEFALEQDLQAATKKPKVSLLAAEMIARVTRLSPQTVLQYAKRARVSGRNQRKVLPRTRRK